MRSVQMILIKTGSDLNRCQNTINHGPGTAVFLSRHIVSFIIGVEGIKAYVDMDKCASLEEYCEPLRQCPLKAIHREEDENYMLGWRTHVDDKKCDGCGICINLCCGYAIGLR